jgi:hypothetical protein
MTYQEYLQRFAASRTGAGGKFTVWNGTLVPLLTRRTFEAKLRELDDKTLMHRHLQRRDHTVPFALERGLDELRAELLLPGDYVLASVQRRVAA